MMLEAAQREKFDVDRLSFRGGCKTCRRGAEVPKHVRRALEQWYDLLLAELVQERSSRAESSQPACSQAQDVEVRQETPGASGPTALKKIFAET